MKIFSIDVGIKNLSFCLFELTNDNKDTLQVLKWDNIDLSDKNNNKCVFIEAGKSSPCDKSAKLMKDNQCYCLKHSKKLNYLQPAADLALPFLNKQKNQTLIEIANKYHIGLEASYKKAKIIELLIEYSKANCFTKIDNVNASKIDLVTVGRNIQHKLDVILGEHLSTIHTIIIENQIGPIANKMKTIQGMLAQYFIMKNNNISIDFISATNKLKDFMPVVAVPVPMDTKDSDNKENKEKKEKLDYKQRKKLGIQTCSNFVDNDIRFKEWCDFFYKHQKKDDLSDCFLQGMWYIKHKLK
jgi:hypothetical protein